MTLHGATALSSISHISRRISRTKGQLNSIPAICDPYLNMDMSLLAPGRLGIHPHLSRNRIVRAGSIISRFITRHLLDDIAREYRKERRLYVVTTSAQYYGIWARPRGAAAFERARADGLRDGHARARARGALCASSMTAE